MKFFLRPPPDPHRILKDPIASKMITFPLKTDGGSPCPFRWTPVYPRYSAGVVPADSFCLDHLHASSLHICQAFHPCGGTFPATGHMAVSQMARPDHGHSPAVTPASPRCPVPDILRGSYDSQFSKSLSCQIQLFSGIWFHNTPFSSSRARSRNLYSVNQLGKWCIIKPAFSWRGETALCDKRIRDTKNKGPQKHFL